MNKVNFNGDLVQRSEALVSLATEGVQLGVGVFETMLADNGQIDGVDLHHQRLLSGVQKFGYELPSFVASLNEFQSAVSKLLEENDLLGEKAKVRVTTMDQTCMIEVSKAPVRSEMCRVNVSDFICNERRATVGVKCSSYADNLLAFRAGKEEGVDEVIMLNTIGEIAEAATANIFIVKDGVIITPHLSSGCLPGVTRELVIRRAKSAGLEVAEMSLSLLDLLDADEVFLTNSLVGVRGVSKVGSLDILDNSDEMPLVTKSVREIYQNGDQ